MKLRVTSIDDHTLDDIFESCRTCVYWERPEEHRKAATEEAEVLKAEWFRATAEAWGPCGKLLYVPESTECGSAGASPSQASPSLRTEHQAPCTETPAAYCQFAPPKHVPGISGYDELAAQVDPDAVFITCLCVREGYQGRGLGPMLLKEVVEDLSNRGCKAVETFARDDSDNNPSGPTKLYLRHGFKVIVTRAWPEGTFSRVRMELGRG